MEIFDDFISDKLHFWPKLSALHNSISFYQSDKHCIVTSDTFHTTKHTCPAFQSFFTEKRKYSCSLLLKDSWCEAKIKLSYFKDGYLLREDDLQRRKHLLNATLLTAGPSVPPLNCMTYIKFSPSFINCAARKNWTCETGCHTAANGHLGGKINH